MMVEEIEEVEEVGRGRGDAGTISTRLIGTITMINFIK